MADFELFLGCLGNGITICNKAVLENGDYKPIAHIRDNGNIKWYVLSFPCSGSGTGKDKTYRRKPEKKLERLVP